MDAVFFPRKDYDVQICAHRLGKTMTYTESTDSLSLDTSYFAFMSLAKARNIKVNCFVEINEFSNALYPSAKQDLDNGKIWFDIYSRCPSLQEKIQSHQPISQEEFENAYITELLPAFFTNVGKKPVTISYSYSNDSFKDYIFPYFLAGRNSIPAASFDTYDFPTDFGVGYGNPNNQPYSVNRYKSKASSYRWYDAARSNDNDFSGQLSIVSQKIDETLLNGGWFNNFTHWHQYWSHGNQQWAETYLNLLQTKNANNQIYFAGYGEAVAYLVFRQMITRAVMYSPLQHHNTQLIIRLETSNTLGVDTDLLQVPISVKFTLVGTPLAGMNIKCNRNLISLGNDDYLVEIPFGRFPYAIIEKD